MVDSGSRSTSKIVFTTAAAFALLLTVACGGGGSSSSEMTPPPQQQFALTQLSTDKFSNPGSQHATEVEPGIFAVGPAIVTTFQVGRFFGGGGSDIGFAISSDGGVSWASGLLPSITQFEGGTYVAASDPTVVYDQAHGVWMISSLAITANNDVVLVSRSPDAATGARRLPSARLPTPTRNGLPATTQRPARSSATVTWSGTIRRRKVSSG